jgi:TonB-dependent SusC/RagA subfamily outer membrane receptor
VSIYLNSIPPQLIESIEVMTGGEAAQFGSRGFNGVILVKTVKQMRDLPFDPKTGFRYIMPQGYHKAPEFYMPRYDEPAVRSLNHTDNRSTIFWSGEVVTDKTGKARVKFYAADRPETYTIHVKGMSAKGDLLEKTITIGKK